MKQSSKASDSLFKARSLPVTILLIIVVLLSAGSGFVGASLFTQQAPNVTTTIYTTTTSWTTSTIWSTMTSVVYGVWTTVQYTTSTSTVTVTQPSSTAASISSITATVTLNVARIVTVTVNLKQGSTVVSTQSFRYNVFTKTHGFFFGGLPSGTYTVTMTGSAVAPQSQTVTVPPDAQVTFTI